MEEPRVIKFKLKLTKAQLRKMTRIKRWEEQSKNVCFTLGPRNV